MRQLVMSIGILISSQFLFAGEIVTVKGLSSGPRSTHPEALYFEAKADAIKQLPFSYFTQTTEWRTTIADVGPQRYVSAEASFRNEDGTDEN